MIGEDSPEADAEMIAMVVTALKSAGLKEFQVELGQVNFSGALQTKPAWMKRPRRSFGS